MIARAAIAAGVCAAVLGGGCDAPSLATTGSAITNGTLDLGDPAVVGVVIRGEIDCTGTVVAPRVVVTAAHCVVGSDIEGVVFGSDLASGTTVSATYVRIHPDFDALTLANDVALVLLAEPSLAPPVLQLAIPVDASFVGRPLRLVGFGQTAPIDGSPGEKREGTATIASLTDDAIEIHGDPSLTCGGDSGGPALLDIDGVEYLAGITSAGDAGCEVLTRSARADVHRSFVDAFVAETADSAAPLGARCYSAAHCATGMCVFPADAPHVGYCSATCTDDATCADGMICDDDRCSYATPSPGALGAPCDTYTDCDGLLCAQASDGGGACSVACDPAVPSCPDGFQCGQDGAQPALHACFEAPASLGGCAARRGSTPSSWLVVLLALACARGRRP